MNDPSGRGPSANFMLLLTSHQSALYAALVALLGGTRGAQDVLQETNAALLEKAGEYDPARPFVPWAMGFARVQALAWRQRQARDRLVLDDGLFAAFADRLTTDPLPPNRRLDALERCLAELPAAARELIDARYRRDESVRSIAMRLGRSENVVSVSLFRARKALLACIQGKLAEDR